MQLMPATARQFGVTDIWDPAQNIRGGTAYLKFLFNRFDGDLRLVLAAYNAGEGAVAKHGNRVPPYRETQGYVRRVLGYLGVG
jgi:soluble lytic murein transglycosylase-like protein